MRRYAHRSFKLFLAVLVIESSCEGGDSEAREVLPAYAELLDGDIDAQQEDLVARPDGPAYSAEDFQRVGSGESELRSHANRPRVTVDGPERRGSNRSGTWTCSASGGSPPYTYVWFKTTEAEITELGSGTRKSTSDSLSFNIVCDVIDRNKNLGTDYVFVDVNGLPDPPELPH